MNSPRYITLFVIITQTIENIPIKSYTNVLFM